MNTGDNPMLDTIRMRAGVTVEPAAGGWSTIVSTEGDNADPLDPHAALEALLAQQIDRDRRISALVDIDAE